MDAKNKNVVLNEARSFHSHTLNPPPSTSPPNSEAALKSPRGGRAGKFLGISKEKMKAPLPQEHTNRSQVAPETSATRSLLGNCSETARKLQLQINQFSEGSNNLSD